MKFMSFTCDINWKIIFINYLNGTEQELKFFVFIALVAMQNIE